MKNKLYILSFAVVLTGIGVLGLMPPSSGIELGEHDKWNHFIAYLVLSLNWCMIENKSKVFSRSFVLWVLWFVPRIPARICAGRLPSSLDALANLGGVMSGFVLHYLMKRFE